MLQYSFRWTAGEYVRAVHAVTRHMRGPNSLQVLVAAALLLLVSAPAVTGAAGAQSVVLGFSAFFGFLAAYWYWVAPWLRARRGLAEDPCAKEDVLHSVGEEAFQVRTRGMSIDVKWAHITQIVETPEFFLFYFNKRTAYFTPKRVIPPADLSVLRARLLGLVGERAHVVSNDAAAA